MTALAHVAYIEAFERKADLGGGFRGIFRDRERDENVKSEEIFPTRDAAIFWCKSKVHDRFAARGYRTASYRTHKGSTSYRANIWA